MCFETKYAAIIPVPEEGVKFSCWKEFYVRVYMNGKFEITSTYSHKKYYNGNLETARDWSVLMPEEKLVVKDGIIENGYHARVGISHSRQIQNAWINELEKYIEIDTYIRVQLGGNVWVNRFGDVVGEQLYMDHNSMTTVGVNDLLRRVEQLVYSLHDRLEWFLGE